jgi:membrane protease YdiL (CAAX protease family)
MRELARKHPVFVYVVVAYALSWSWWIPLAVRGAVITPGGTETHFPGLLGPAIAAFITTGLVSGRSGVRALLRRLWLVSPPSPRFWMYTLSPLAFTALGVVVAAAAGRAPRWSDFALFSGLPPLPIAAVLALALAFNGYGEEVGWRGFALPQLQERFGFIGGALLVALAWALWHAPTFWTIEGYTSMTIPVLIGGFGVGLTCGAIVLADVARKTHGSILAASLWHLLYNMSAATMAGRGIVGAVSTACVETWAIIIVVQEIRRRPARERSS